MRLRLELFVDDLDTSIGFYAALGFAVERREHDYASLRWGDAVSASARSPSSRRPAPDQASPRSASPASAAQASRSCSRSRTSTSPSQPSTQWATRSPSEPADQPWGLRDFRLTDPDGYYLRITTRAHPGSDPAAQQNEASPLASTHLDTPSGSDPAAQNEVGWAK